MNPAEVQQNLDILGNAKNYMFAEDLIANLMAYRGQDTNNWKSIKEEHRCLVDVAFNGMIGLSTLFLYNRIAVYNSFLSFQANNLVTKGTFLLFAQHLENRYFPNNVYNPEKFIYFCAQLGYMVTSFYEDIPVEIPKLAVTYIVKTIKSFKIPESQFWNGLNIAAFRYLRMANECGFSSSIIHGKLNVQLRVTKNVKEQYLDKKSLQDEMAEQDKTTTKTETDVVKLAAELRKKLTIIDNKTVDNKNNQSELENLMTLYKESQSEESSDSNESETKEMLKSAEEKESGPKIKPIPPRTTSPSRKKEISVLLDNLLDRSLPIDPPQERDLLESHEMKQKKESKLAETTVKKKCSEKFSPIVNEVNVGASTSSDQSYLKWQSTALSEGEFFSATSQESATQTISEEIEESELESKQMVTVNVPVNSELFCDMLALTEESNLHENSHIAFICTEDDFNGTFDILTVIHYMASNLGIEILDVGNMN